jgi:phage-related protein
MQSQIQASLKKTLDAMSKGWTSFFEQTGSDLDGYYIHVQNVIDHVGHVWSDGFTDIHRIVNTIWHAIDNDVFHPIENWFTQSVPHALSVASGFFTTGWQDIHDIANTSYHAVQNDVLDPIWNWFTQSLPNALGQVPAFFKNMWDDVKNDAVAAWNWLYNTVLLPIGDFFSKTIPSVVGQVAGFFRQMWGDIESDGVAAWHWVLDNVWNPLVNFITGIPSDISHVWSDIVSDIHTAWSDIASWVNANVVSPIEGFFDGMVGTVTSAINDVIQGYEDTVGKIPGAPQIQKIGGHAEGTGMGTFQGTTWVGEKGPELVNFGSPVQIIPNSAFQGAGKGRSGPAVAIGQATFVDQADLEMLMRKADFALAGSRL